jgi:hypothetical protein
VASLQKPPAAVVVVVVILARERGDVERAPQIRVLHVLIRPNSCLAAALGGVHGVAWLGTSKVLASLFVEHKSIFFLNKNAPPIFLSYGAWRACLYFAIIFGLPVRDQK